MPELPEVETVCRGLRSHVLGKRIARYHQFREDLRWPLPFGIKEKVEGSIIEELNRRGKFLLFKLSSDYIFIMHLGMSGRILVTELSRKENESKYPNEMGSFFKKIKPTELHDHVVIDFCDQTRITYNDPRRFGAIDIVDLDMINQHKWLSKLGPEPLGNSFSPEVLQLSLKNKRSCIKTALIDQSILSGLGNIYVCEALWAARISPFRPCYKIDGLEFQYLTESVIKVLKKAIQAGGSSLRDFKKVGGGLGYFQNCFNVYSKDGCKCKRERCNSRIQREIQSGRSTFFCPKCQL